MWPFLLCWSALLAGHEQGEAAAHAGGAQSDSLSCEQDKQLLKEKPEHVGLKVGVRTRGCNGLPYTPGVYKDEVTQVGVRVFIEKKAQLTLLGTEIDYVEDRLSSAFLFNNPNIKGTCGCAESFNI